MARTNRHGLKTGSAAYWARMGEVDALRKYSRPYGRGSAAHSRAVPRWKLDGGLTRGVRGGRSNRMGLVRGGEAYRVRVAEVLGKRKLRRRSKARKAKAMSGGRRRRRRTGRRRGKSVVSQSAAQVRAFVKSQKGLLRWAKAHGNRGLAVKCAKTLGTIHRKTGKR